MLSCVRSPPADSRKSCASVSSVSTLTNNSSFKVDLARDKVTKCKPVTLTSRSPNVGLQRKKYFLNTSLSQSLLEPSPTSHHQSDHLLNTNFPLEQDDLFNELNSSIDSFDSINDIDFCYDDPFKVF